MDYEKIKLLFMEINLFSIILRLILSALLSGLLGVDRGKKNRPAGFRTYMLVSVGATIIMMTNQFVFEYFQVSDPVRMGAQVVSGIGFLGAGIIFIRNNIVSGLTTAAGIWTTSGIGLCVGAGNYFVGIVSTILILTLQEILHSKLFTNDIIQEDITIVMKNDKDIIPYIEEKLQVINIEISFYEVHKQDDDTMRVEATILYRAHSYHDRYEQIKNIFLENEDIISYKIQY